MKTIGILGGLGPESTCEYYRIITRRYYDLYGNYTYPEIIIYSLTFSNFIHCGYEAAVDIRDAILKLHRAGADFVVAACNSIHIVYDAVAVDLPIPWISIMDVVAEEINRRKLVRVGLLGTIFTMSKGFYQKALNAHGIETITPESNEQQRINDIIYQELVRGITTAESKDYMLGIIDKLASDGAQGIILGCTELPFLIKQEDTAIPVFDSTELHACKALELAVAAV